jgi:DNA-binding CsgD family transcriptional regulator
MLQVLSVRKVNLRAGQFVPPLMEPLVAAAQRGEPLVPYVRAVAHSFGFDSLEYETTLAGREAVRYSYTTVTEWTTRYASMGYIDVDPRVLLARKSAIPLVWDQGSLRGLGLKADAFLDDAQAHGIASGVSFMWHGPADTYVLVALDSPVARNDEIRTRAITRNLPDMTMFVHYFHELFMVPALPAVDAPAIRVQPLSHRERECLSLAANGLTTRDISHKLDISSRTVQFHFDKIYAKLGASNRQEAVARGVQNGIIRAG